jgi:uncharacterized phage infection (PIP) family protein YhgE
MVVHRRTKPSKSSRARFNNFLKTQRERNEIRRKEVIKINNLIKTSQAKELEKLTLEVEEKDDNYEELSNLHNNLFERFELAQKGINELKDSNDSLRKQLASRDKLFHNSQTKLKAERNKLKGENTLLKGELKEKDIELNRFLIKEYEG